MHESSYPCYLASEDMTAPRLLVVREKTPRP